MWKDLSKVKKQNVVEIPIPWQEKNTPKKKTPEEKKVDRIEKVENRLDVSSWLNKIKRPLLRNL